MVPVDDFLILICKETALRPVQNNHLSNVLENQINESLLYTNNFVLLKCGHLWRLLSTHWPRLSLSHSFTNVHNIYILILIQKIASLAMCWNNLFQHLMHHLSRISTCCVITIWPQPIVKYLIVRLDKQYKV